MAYNALLAIKEQTGKSISGGGRTVSSGRSIDDEKKAGKEALNENPSSLTKMLSDPETVHATSTNEYLANTLGDKAPQPKQPEKTSVFRKLFGGTDEQYDEEDRKDSANPLQKPLNLTQQIEKKKSDLAKAEEVAAYAVDADAGSKAAKDVARIKSELDRLEELDGKKKTSVIDWAKNVGGAAGNSYLSGLTGTQETLFEMGSGYRSKEAEARMKELEPQIERQRIQYEDLLNSGEYDPAPAKAKLDELQAEYDALKKGYSEEVSAGAAKGASDIANNLALKAQEQTQAAKDAAGNTFVGDLVTDASISGIQSLADRVLGFGLGGAGSKGLGLANMGLRVFGSSSMEAMNDGATLPQRVSFGAANVIKEIGTESALDVMKEIPALAKGGWVNDSVEKVIAKYAKTDSGRTALRTLFAFLGEAAEEGVGGAIDPSLKAIYQGKEAFKGYNKQQAAETLYSMLVGGVSGAAGAGANIVLGGNVTANEKIRVAEAVAQSQNIDFNTAYDMVESELNRGKSLQQVSQENTITPDAASQISAVEQMQDRGEQAQPAEATAPTPLVEQERRTSGEERAEAKAPSAPVYSSELAQFSDEEISDLTRKYGSPKRFVERIIPEAIRTGEFVIDLSFNNQNIIPSIANRYLYSLGYELKSDGFSTVDDTQRYRVVPINDSVETTSQTTEAPTVETANPIVRTLQERSTAGETRAEEMAPEAPRQNPLLREEQPVEAEQTAPSNPLLDTLQPMSAEERNMTGEERAEEQAPETPATPVDAKAERASRRAELENRRASIEEQIQKYQSEIDQIKKDANSQKTLEEIKLYKQQSKDALDYYTGEIKNLQGQLEPIISGLRAIASEENAEKRQASIERAEIEGSKKVPNPTAEKHIDNRTLDDASKRNVNAFQYDNPEVKPFFKKAAVVLRRDLLNASANYVKGYGAMPLNNTFMKRAVAVCGSVSDAIQACEQLIYDKGRENFADPKKLELILDDMLSKGYSPSDSSLPVLGVDNEYLRTKGRLSGGTEFNEDARARAIQSILESDFEGLFDEQSAAEWVDQNFERTGSYDTATMDGASPVQNRDGYPTLDELDAKDTADLEAQYGKYAPKAEAKNNDESASTEPITPTNENAQQESENHEQAPSQQFNSNTESTTEETPQNGNPTPPTPPLEPLTEEQQNEYDSLVNEKGRIEPGENPARDIPVPKENSAGENISETARTVAEAKATPEERLNDIKGAVLNGELSYVPVSNQSLADKARAKIEKNGWQASLTEFMSAAKAGKSNERIIALGAQLLNNAGNSNMSGREYVDLLIAYKNVVHDSARGLQAARILKTLSPEAKLYAMQRAVDEINDKITDSNGRKGGREARGKVEDTEKFGKAASDSGVSLNPELAERYKNAKTDAERDAIVDEMTRDIARQIPSTLKDKFAAIRYLNMLGNLKTVGRNLAGNTVMALTTKVKNTIKAASETVAKATGTIDDKQYSTFHTAEQAKAARADFNNNEDVKSLASGEKKYSSVSQQFSADIEDARHKTGNIFKFGDNALTRTLGINGKQGLIGKGLSFADRALDAMLNKYGDEVFVKMTYVDALSGWMNAHKVSGSEWTELVEKAKAGDTAAQSKVDSARAFAAKQAQEATFHDTNDVSKFVTNFDANFPAPVKAMTQGVIPFRKTPANVAVRMEEYSPLGFVNTAVKSAMKIAGNENISGNDIIDSLAKSLTGTGIFALGFIMRSMGKARATADDDEQEYFDKLNGLQDYSINVNIPGIGNRNYTIDWMAPVSGTFFMGVTAYDLWEDGTFQPKDLFNMLSRLTSPMLQMSMLSGLNDALNNVSSYGDDPNGLATLALNSMWSYLTQGISSTLAGQFEQYFEDYRQTYYTDKDNPLLGTKVQKMLAKLGNKTPGVDYQAADYIDAWGRKQSQGEDGFFKAFNVFANPGYSSDLDAKATGVEDELQRLYDFGNTQDSFPNVYPQNISRSTTVNGTQLSPEEYDTYAQTAGQTKLSLVQELINSDTYKGMDDLSKAETIRDLYSYAEDLANAECANNRGEEYNSDIQKLLNGENKAGTTYDKTPLKEDNVVAYYSVYNGMGNAIENNDYSAIDGFVKSYGNMDSNLQKVVTERVSDFKNVKKYADVGVKSESYYEVQRAVTDAQNELDKSAKSGGDVKLLGLINADIPESEKRALIENYESTDAVNKTQYQSYTAMKDYGVSLESLYDFGEDVKYRVDKETGEVKVKTSNFDAASAAFAISQIPGLSDDERSAIFNSLKGEWSNYYNDWKNYTYQSEIDYINSDRCKYLYGVDAANGYGVEGAEGSSTGTTYKKGGGYYKRRGYGGKSSATKSPTINKQLTKLLQQGSSQSASKIKNRSYAPSLNNSKSSSYEYFKQRIKA